MGSPAGSRRKLRLRRRPRHLKRRHPLVRAIGAVVLLAAGTTAFMFSMHGRHSRIQTAGLIPVGPAPAAPSPATSAENTEPMWPAFAAARGVRLYLPAADPVAITYHEASFHNALALHPIGHIVRNANKWKFDSPARTPGPGYIVMSSRGRDTPATSAADVVLRRSTPFRSPVTGVVVEVREYHLYCRYTDEEVKIRPDGGHGVSVVMIHLRGIRVRPGDRVFATLSVIGFPRVFPFRSQVDDYVLGGNPHVHIEIAKPHKARLTAC